MQAAFFNKFNIRQMKTEPLTLTDFVLHWRAEREKIIRKLEEAGESIARSVGDYKRAAELNNSYNTNQPK